MGRLNRTWIEPTYAPTVRPGPNDNVYVSLPGQPEELLSNAQAKLLVLNLLQYLDKNQAHLLDIELGAIEVHQEL
jgi:hypothetical protein